MPKSIWGIDFGDWALKVVRGSYDRKSATITIDLFDTIVYGTLDCGYEASSLEKHREGVRAFQQKYEVGSGDDVCVCVTGSEVFSRFINLPPVPESIGEIIRYEARQQIPFDIDDVVWDYQPVKPREELEEGEEIEVGLFALKRERVNELMELIEAWQGNLRVVQNAPLAVYNLLAYEGVSDEATVVVDVGAATTDVLVLNPPRFWVRTLLVAGDDVTNALVEQFGVDLDEAEKIKRRAGRSQHREQILRVIQPVFDELVNEIQRSLGYYKSLAREVRFEKVLALGNALSMTGLTQMLAGGLQYPVQAFKEMERIKLADSIDRERFEAALPGLCAALGLVVQGAGQAAVQINMVPEEVALTRAVSTKQPWLLAAGVGLVLAVALLIVGERVHAQQIERAQQQIQQQWSVVEQAEKKTKDWKNAAGEATRLRQRLSTLASPGIDPGFYLDLLPVYADTMPDDVYTMAVRFDWMPPGDVGDQMATATGERAAGQTARTASRAMGAQMGGMASAMAQQSAMGATMGAAGSRGGGRAGGAARTAAPGTAAAQPVAGAGTVLVMRFSCESATPSQDYIEKNVFAALRNAKLPGGPNAFREVKMQGGLRDVYRDPVTGESVARGEPGAEHFVVFDGYAIANVGQAPGGGK